MKILFSNIIKIALAVFLFAGCSKDVLVENPPNILAGPTILRNYDGFDAGINGLYNIARHGRWQSEKIENALNGVDNMTSNFRRSDIFWNWGTSNSPSDGDLLETFQWLYEIINAANTLMYYVNNDIDWTGSGDTPENSKLKVIAEARALRAWAYRRLTYSWGDVPLSLVMEPGVKTDWERTPVLEVRKQVIRDLAFAQEYIPTEGSGKGASTGRITKGAVQTLLAEMYLTLNNPDSALYWCDQAISNPAYKLVTERYGVKKSDPSGSPFGDMFKEGNQNRLSGNTEALWVFQFTLNSSLDLSGDMDEAQGNETSRALVGRYGEWKIGGKAVFAYTYERGGRGKAYFGPTKWWVDSYEDQDDRAQNYILRKYFTINNATANSPYPADQLPSGYNYGDTIWCDNSTPLSPTYNSKTFVSYSRKGEGTDPGNMQWDFSPHDQVYLRLADTYLLKAEAQFKLGQSGPAATTINIIRQRSNATPITAGDVTLDFILDERSRELFQEEERRGTLLRTHTWYDRTRAHNFYGGELITLRDTIFPIPQDVIDANLTKKMPQNPGFD